MLQVKATPLLWVLLFLVSWTEERFICTGVLLYRVQSFLFLTHHIMLSLLLSKIKLGHNTLDHVQLRDKLKRLPGRTIPQSRRMTA